MRTVFLFIFLCSFVYGQSAELFTDSLKKAGVKDIITLKITCSHCTVLAAPCKQYEEEGWDLLVYWKTNDGNFLKRYNNCGSYKKIKVDWPEDPFTIVKDHATEIDTTMPLYPVQMNEKDSTWIVSAAPKQKTFTLGFPGQPVHSKTVLDIAFKEVNEWELDNSASAEDKINTQRYLHNNKMVIKKLIDLLQRKFFDSWNKFIREF